MVYSLALSLFLTVLEIPIVTTALVSIVDDLGGLDRVSWIATSYLLGYTGK
jgi:MFS family permease